MPTIPQVLDAALTGVLDGVANLLNAFPANPLTEYLSAALLAWRREWFDHAPTAAPQQYKPYETGVIGGFVAGVDPEADPVVYALTQAPTHGTVTVDASTGAYVYTPGAGYDPATGDSFTVAATDTTDGRNFLLDPFTAANPAAAASAGTGTTANSDTTTAVTVTLNSHGDTLANGQRLLPNEYLQTANARYRLYMQDNGDLVLWGMSDTGAYQNAAWKSGTNGHTGEGVYAYMQPDGRFVVYKPNDVTWYAQTSCGDGCFLDYVRPLWSSGTAGWGPTTYVSLSENKAAFYLTQVRYVGETKEETSMEFDYASPKGFVLGYMPGLV